MTPNPITAADAKALVDRGESVTFVDARNPTAWESSFQKLPGALRIPVDEFDAHFGEVPRRGVLISYCT
jgi:rhodanese-related sulfurtransferase